MIETFLIVVIGIIAVLSLIRSIARRSIEIKNEQERSKEALQKSEKKFRDIIENLPMGVHIYRLEPDGQLRFIGANIAADKILGVDNTQYIGKTICEAFPEISRTDVPWRFRTIAEKGGFWHEE